MNEAKNEYSRLYNYGKTLDEVTITYWLLKCENVQCQALLDNVAGLKTENFYLHLWLGHFIYDSHILSYVV